MTSSAIFKKSTKIAERFKRHSSAAKEEVDNTLSKAQNLVGDFRQNARNGLDNMRQQGASLTQNVQGQAQNALNQAQSHGQQFRENAHNQLANLKQQGDAFGNRAQQQAQQLGQNARNQFADLRQRGEAFGNRAQEQAHQIGQNARQFGDNMAQGFGKMF